MPPPLSIHAWLRYATVRSLLAEVQGVQSVLEIGAGGGAVGALLAQRYDYLGVEPDSESFSLAVRRIGRSGGRVLNSSVEELGDDMTFDLVVALEVLEHFEDDRAVLREWRRRVRPGGRLVASVPAGPHRFAAADERAGHFRRYDRGGLERALAESGFREIRIRAYGFPIGYALEAGRNALARRRSQRGSLEERTLASGRWLQPPDGAASALRLAALPFVAVQRPFASSDLGTGLVALARRPGSGSNPPSVSGPDRGGRPP